MTKGSVSCLLVGLASVWLYALPCVYGQTTEEAGEAGEPKFEFSITTVARTTSSIAINWTVPYFYKDKIQDIVVESRRTTSESITRSPKLDGKETEYEVEDLVVDTEYEICLKGSFQVDSGVKQDGDCVRISTIQRIRPDSLAALFGVIGFILLIVLLAYCCARYHAKKAEEEEESEEVIGNSDKKDLIYQPNNPHASSIEDADIPYITPPVDQLSKDDKEIYYSRL